MKYVFLFSGQGAQFKGMVQDICTEFRSAKAVIDEISGITGVDTGRLLWETENEELSRSDRSQLAIIAAESAILAVLKEHGIEPSAAAGFSLGEFSALYAAGILDFKTMIRLVHRRGQIMQETCDKIAARSASAGGASGMAAVIRLDPEKVKELLAPYSDRKNGIVFAANMNSPVQTVVSGTAEGLDTAEKLCKEAGAKRFVRLAVAGPFHSPLMAEAAEAFEAELAGVDFADPAVPIFSNVTGTRITSGAEAKKNAVLHLTHPVLWTNEEKEMASFISGFEACRLLEVGPGNTLTNLWRDSGFSSERFQAQAAGTAENLKKIINNL